MDSQVTARDAGSSPSDATSLDLFHALVDAACTIDGLQDTSILDHDRLRLAEVATALTPTDEEVAFRREHEEKKRRLKLERRTTIARVNQEIKDEAGDALRSSSFDLEYDSSNAVSRSASGSSTQNQIVNASHFLHVQPAQKVVVWRAEEYIQGRGAHIDQEWVDVELEPVPLPPKSEQASAFPGHWIDQYTSIRDVEGVAMVKRFEERHAPRSAKRVRFHAGAADHSKLEWTAAQDVCGGKPSWSKRVDC